MNARECTLAIATLLAVAACGSTGATGDATTAGAPAPSAASGSADPCAAFTEAVGRTVMPFVSLKMAMGTDEEQVDRLAALSTTTATLASDAPGCAPAAADDLAVLHERTLELAQEYVPGTDGAAREGINAILIQIRTAGTAAWTAMDMPTSSWEYLPLREDGSTT